jgi:hypothetical protein
MRTIISRILGLGAATAVLCLLAGSAAQAQQINGIALMPRVFNDHPETTLTMTTSNTIPGSVTIDDRGAATTGGANRHDALLSADHGVTPYTFSIDTGFTMSATFVLTDGSNSPRKEAGLRINSPVGGDALFIVNSDAGEIVTFGGGAPFHLFGNNAGGNGYTPGTPITMAMTYTPGPGGTTQANPATIDYRVTYAGLNGGATVDTGPLAWSNNEGGPTNFQVGVYGQWGPANQADFIHVAYTNVTGSIVPEPASLGLIGLAGLTLAGRRRRA